MTAASAGSIGAPKTLIILSISACPMVVAHKKSVVRCDRGLEVRDWCLVIRGSVGQLYQRRLSRERVEDCGTVDTLRQTRDERRPLLRYRRSRRQSRHDGRQCASYPGNDRAPTNHACLPPHWGFFHPNHCLLYGNTDTQGIASDVNPQPTDTG